MTLNGTQDSLVESWTITDLALQPTESVADEEVTNVCGWNVLRPAGRSALGKGLRLFRGTRSQVLTRGGSVRRSGRRTSILIVRLLGHAQRNSRYLGLALFRMLTDALNDMAITIAGGKVHA